MRPRPSSVTGSPRLGNFEFAFRVDLIPSNFQVFGKCGQVRPQVRSEYFGCTFFMVPLDNLPYPSARSRVEIQAQVVAAKVMSKGHPTDVPVVGLDPAPSRVSWYFVVSKRSLLEEAPQSIAFLPHLLQRKQTETGKHGHTSAAVMDSKAVPNIVGQN